MPAMFWMLVMVGVVLVTMWVAALSAGDNWREDTLEEWDNGLAHVVEPKCSELHASV